MENAETPGRYAFGSYSEAYVQPGNRFILGQSAGFGFTTDLRINIGMVMKNVNEHAALTSTGGMLGAKLRMVNKNREGVKQTAALTIDNHVSTPQDGTKTKPLDDELLLRLTYGEERISFVTLHDFWVGPATARAFAGSPNANAHGGGADAVYDAWIDSSIGWRFYPFSDSAFNIGPFLALNLRAARSPAEFLTPEIWLFPAAEVMMKFGYRTSLDKGARYRYRIVNFSDGQTLNASPGGEWGYEMSIQF